MVVQVVKVELTSKSKLHTDGLRNRCNSVRRSPLKRLIKQYLQGFYACLPLCACGTSWHYSDMKVVGTCRQIRQLPNRELDRRRGGFVRTERPK